MKGDALQKLLKTVQTKSDCSEVQSDQDLHYLLVIGLGTLRKLVTGTVFVAEA